MSHWGFYMCIRKKICFLSTFACAVYDFTMLYIHSSVLLEKWLSQVLKKLFLIRKNYLCEA